jgi:hypothetical protein
MEHECKTYDGVPIKLGLRVRDYDNKVGTVVREPHDYELNDDVCWPEVGHGGHWWSVCEDREGHIHNFSIGSPDRCRGGSFDGSRMTTRDVPQDYEKDVIGYTITARFEVSWNKSDCETEAEWHELKMRAIRYSLEDIKDVADSTWPTTYELLDSPGTTVTPVLFEMKMPNG